MKVLFVDTTTADLVAAVIEKDKIYSVMDKAVGVRHSETLCGKVDEVLRKANVNFADLDAYACAVGPGSFTGIRIGVSTVKGYATAYNRPYIEVNCLEAIARSVNLGAVGYSVIDAGNGYYYMGRDGVASPSVIAYDDERAVGAGRTDSAAEYFDGAADIIRCKFGKGEFDCDLAPVYIRKSQAEVTLQNKEKTK